MSGRCCPCRRVSTSGSAAHPGIHFLKVRRGEADEQEEGGMLWTPHSQNPEEEKEAVPPRGFQGQGDKGLWEGSVWLGPSHSGLGAGHCLVPHPYSPPGGHMWLCTFMTSHFDQRGRGCGQLRVTLVSPAVSLTLCPPTSWSPPCPCVPACERRGTPSFNI